MATEQNHNSFNREFGNTAGNRLPVENTQFLDDERQFAILHAQVAAGLRPMSSTQEVAARVGRICEGTFSDRLVGSDSRN